jgi:acylphosphatase
MMRRAEILVRGLVQGVFFRYNTKRKADEFNIKGLVRNLSDGSVQVISEGADNDIARLVEWCKKGPQGAVVEGVDVTWGRMKGSSLIFGLRTDHCAVRQPAR